jgi:hypothetical protein
MRIAPERVVSPLPQPSSIRQPRQRLLVRCERGERGQTPLQRQRHGPLRRRTREQGRALRPTPFLVLSAAPLPFASLVFFLFFFFF